jgi:SAM-dependent methyltransferase
MAIEPIYDQPGLYDAVLPRYTFNNIADEELLRHALGQLTAAHPAQRVLELGCGTGRMTTIIRGFADELTCVDYSAAMLDTFQARYPDLTPIHTDAREFVERAHHQIPQPVFDLIAACWSLNYPLLACFETNTGTAIVPRDLDAGRRDAAGFLSAVTNLLAPGGHLLAFFFDPDSAEQRFVTDVWESVAPFPGTGRDFTRRLLLDHLQRCDGAVTTHHYNGRMLSPTLAHAEQWFLEGHFKSFPALAGTPEIRDTVRAFLINYTHDDGTVQVPAGVYVTTFTRS